MFLAVAQFAAYADNEYGTVFLADSVLLPTKTET